MNIKKSITILSLAALLANSTINNAKADGGDLLGTLLGAAGGAAVGSNIGKGKGRIVAIAAGTLLGAGIGNSVGRSVDRSNSSYYSSTTTSNSYPEYSQYPSNPVYGRTDYVVPNYQYAPVPQYNQVQNVQYVAVNNNTQESKYCREFTQNVNIGGHIKSSYGTACRQPDGSWEIQK